MGLLIAIDRHIAAGTADLRAGTWNKKAYSKAEGLFGRRMGIIGVGDIGIATAARGERAFGIDVVAVAKPGRSDLAIARAEAAGITFVDTLDELLATSDIVSLHVPGSTDTKGMVDTEFLAKMKDGAVLLNTSRGDVVDEAALIDAMDNRGMRAGLDVYATSPAPERPSSTRPRQTPECRRHPSRRRFDQPGPGRRHRRHDRHRPGVPRRRTGQLCEPRSGAGARRDPHRASSRSRRRARQRAADPSQGRAQRLEHAEPVSPDRRPPSRRSTSGISPAPRSSMRFRPSRMSSTSP